MNKDFERFELGPNEREAREAMEDERFALGPIIITARRAQQAHCNGEAALHLEAAAL